MKHIGKHGDKKVVIVYRQIPGEEHMALVVYTETIPTSFHDAIINVVESDAGQQADELADALHRNLLPDGRPILETIHNERMLKKAQTNQIVITPNAKSHVRLDELNRVLNDLKIGGEAADKLREIDEQAGLVDPSSSRKAEVVKEAQVNTGQALGDDQIANDLLSQSQRMAAEAESLLAESKRLQDEAYSMNPALRPKRATAKKKSTAKKRVATKAKA